MTYILKRDPQVLRPIRIAKAKRRAIGVGALRLHAHE